MAASPTSSAEGSASAHERDAATEAATRRTAIWAAVILTVAILGGVIAVAALTDGSTGGPRRDTQGQQEGVAARPHIIERPNSGTAPKDAGDRGGWEQLALLTMIVVAVGAIVVVAMRGGGAKARASRAAWQEAAASGHDGAVD